MATTPETSSPEDNGNVAAPSSHQRFWQVLEAETRFLHPHSDAESPALTFDERRANLAQELTAALAQLGDSPAEDKAAEAREYAAKRNALQRKSERAGFALDREELKAKRLKELDRLAPDDDWGRAEAEKWYDKNIIRTLNDELHRLPAGEHSAICLSGGGIRSATFALGALQALARYGHLDRFAYLSTVSGGGYIGSWLTSWIHNRAIDGFTAQDLADGRNPTEAELLASRDAVFKALGRTPTNAGEDQRDGGKATADHDPTEPEPEPLRHLRRYSNYLTPKLGFFSADTWTVVATVMRNLVLTWLLLVPAILATLLLPRFGYAAMAHPVGASAPLQISAVVLGLLAAVIALHHLVVAPERTGQRSGAQQAFIGRALVPLCASGALLLLAWGWSVQNGETLADWLRAGGPVGRWQLLKVGGTWLADHLPPWWALGALGGLATGLLTLVACRIWPPEEPSNYIDRARFEEQRKGQAFWLFLICIFAGLVLAWSAEKTVEMAVDHAETEAAIAQKKGAPQTLPELPQQALLTLPGGMSLFAGSRASEFVASVPKIEKLSEFARVGTEEKVVSAAIDPATVRRVVFRQHLLRGAVSVGLTVFFLILFLALTIYMGGRSHRMLDDRREWFARANGWTFIAAAAWLIVGCVVLWGPDWLAWLTPKITAAIGGGAGLLTILGGGSSGSPANAQEKEKGGWPAALKQWAVKFAAPIFAVTLLMLLSLFTSWLLEQIAWRPGFGIDRGDGTTWHETRLQDSHFSLLCAMMGIFVAVSWTASRRINVNRFSLNAMYRNRLIRAYLGASRSKARRRPDPFTGFDRHDNFPVCKLVGQRPFHVLNMALNVVGGSELAWQERQAETFTVTPLTCGNHHLGYRPSAEYALGEDGIPMTLGTAVSISGAAASPNHGYNSSAPVAFLMTLFNARLGAWFGNPGVKGDAFITSDTEKLARRFIPLLGWAIDALRKEKGQRAYQMEAPPRPLAHLAKEALALTNDQEPFVYLSDGGHFENLGLYEMVLRRCSFILVSDAGCDPKHHFEDLGKAVAKIRVDLGIPINFTGEIPIYPRGIAERPKKSCDRRYAVVGEICYPAVDGEGAQKGMLVYVKPALCDFEPVDVFHYAQESAKFPHESTGDQWFSESQFESYRMLGFNAIYSVCERDLPEPKKEAADQELPAKGTLAYLIEQIRQHKPDWSRTA